MTRLAKSTIIVGALSLLLTACRHIEPERSSSEAQIRQHIVGEWTWIEKSDARWASKMNLAEDRTVTMVGDDGTRMVIGTWELRSTTLSFQLRTDVVESAPSPPNLWDYYYPVIYADAHELVMAPGISVAGRLRFTK